MKDQRSFSSSFPSRSHPSLLPIPSHPSHLPPPPPYSLPPGGAAERAGLRQNDIVVAVNGRSVVQLSHKEVVSLINHTSGSSVWLSVCEPTNRPHHFRPSHAPPGRSGLGNFRISQSSPALPRSIERRARDTEAPLHTSPLASGRSGSLGRKIMQSAGFSEKPSPPSYNGKAYPLGTSPISSSAFTLHDRSRGPASQQQQRPSLNASPYNSVSVRVQYIGPVEIPESWGSRGLSSKCIKECMRRLLSKRCDFMEVLLDVNLHTVKVVNMQEVLLFKHKREELYYTGMCSDDEQYFAIVTRKLEPKGSKKTDSHPDSVARANMCHVFQIIVGRSVMVLQSIKDKERSRANQELKPRSVDISSCVPVIGAIRALFQGNVAELLACVEPPPQQAGGLQAGGLLRSAGYTASMQSNISLRSNVGGGAPMERSPNSKRKQFGVIDLRPGAVLSEQNGLTSSSTQSGSHASREASQAIPFPPQAAAPFPPQATPFSKQDYRYQSATTYDLSKSSGSSVGSGPYGRGEVQPLNGGRDDVPPAWRANDEVRKVSDNSSLSSYSSRCSSPNKMPLSQRSSYASHSSSSPPNSPPSPSSPVHIQRRFSPDVPALPQAAPAASSRLPGLDLVTSLAGRDLDHTPLSGSLIRGSRLTLRRQVNILCTACSTLGREFGATVAALMHTPSYFGQDK